MSSLKIMVANFFAKQSCAAWQSNRVIRKICRKAYRLIMESGAKSYPYKNIRHSTSYVAWMMKKYCGVWPKLPVPGPRMPGEHKFDAKHWDEVLEFNGWQRVPKASWPTQLDTEKGIHFIGIQANEGEFGQLFWFVGHEKDDFREVGYWHTVTYYFSMETRVPIPASEKAGIVWYRQPQP